MLKTLYRNGQVFQSYLRGLLAVLISLSFVFTPSSPVFAANNNCVLKLSPRADQPCDRDPV